MSKVTMNLNDDELRLIDNIQKKLNLDTKTGTIIQSLRIAELIVDHIKQGNDVSFMDNSGRRLNSKLIIPNLND